MGSSALVCEREGGLSLAFLRVLLPHDFLLYAGGRGDSSLSSPAGLRPNLREAAQSPVSSCLSNSPWDQCLLWGGEALALVHPEYGGKYSGEPVNPPAVRGYQYALRRALGAYHLCYFDLFSWLEVRESKLQF